MSDKIKSLSEKVLFEESLKGTRMMIYFRWLFILLISVLIIMQSLAGHFQESIHSLVLTGIYTIANMCFWLALKQKYDPVWLRYLSGSIDVGIIVFHLHFLTANFDAYAVTSAATIILIPVMFLLYTFKLDRNLILYLILFSIISFSAAYINAYIKDTFIYEQSLSFSPVSHFFKSVYITFVGLLCIYLQYSYRQLIDKSVDEATKKAQLNTEFELEKQKSHYANTQIEKERTLNKKLEQEIAEKNALAESLRQSQEQINSVLSNLVGAAYRCKPDDKWTMLFISSQIVDITEYSDSEIINNQKISYKEIIHPDDLEWSVRYINEKVSKCLPFELEYRIKTKSNKTVWVHESGQGIYDGGGNLIYLDGIIIDITEKKYAEKSLKETQEIVNSLISNLSGAASRCLYDEHFTVKYYSEKIYDITGYYPDDFIDNKELSFSEIIHEDDIPNVKLEIDNAIKNKSHYSIDYRIRNKNGDIRWVNESGQPILDTDGSTLYLDGITYDITYKKEVESALKSTEQKYQKIIETSPVPMSFAKLNNEIEYVNQAFVKTFGYTLDEIPNLETYLEKLYPDKDYRNSIYPDWKESIEMAHKLEVPIKPFDVKMTCKNGEIRNIVIYSAILDDGVFVVFNDVTEIKSTNTALQESERKYRELMDFLPQTIYELDTQGNLIFCNKIGRDIFGIDEDLEKEKVYAFKYFIPEDKNRMIELARKRHSGEIVNDYNEYTALDKNGKQFPVIIYASPLLKENKIIGSRGIILDITKLKETEKSLSKAKQELEELNLRLEKEVDERTKELTEANIKLIQLQKDNLQSQFEVLKQQVNPHFLFNSLNVLTSLIKVEPDLAEAFTEKLSKVYRYVLEYKEKDMVPLSTEIDFIKAYIFLLDIRFMGKVFVKLDISPNMYEWLILPMALQLIIENAIKHNTFSKLKPLYINIQIDKNNNLVIDNNLQIRDTYVESTGVGLSNIANRYKLISGLEPQFIKTDKSFIVKIPLIKQE
jgi:PAS domain S-box-containing protein